MQINITFVQILDVLGGHGVLPPYGQYPPPPETNDDGYIDPPGLPSSDN